MKYFKIFQKCWEIYLNEVVEINQLSSTTIIKGQHLVVPYYEANYK